VYLPQHADWLECYLHELTTFPAGKHDDQTDSTSQAIDWAKQGMYRYPLHEYYLREAIKNGWEIDPSMLDDDLLSSGGEPIRCSQCGNRGPAQYGRTIAAINADTNGKTSVIGETIRRSHAAGLPTISLCGTTVEECG
jgi:hypothetical protein